MGRKKSKTWRGWMQGNEKDNFRTESVARSEATIPMGRGEEMLVITA